MQLGAVSLTFRELPKIFSRKYTAPEITLMVKICTCAQSTLTKFQLEILITSTICALHKCRDNFLESSRNVSETTPVSGAGEEGRGGS